MRFFADHCVPNSVQTWLADRGHTVYRLADHLPVESDDEDVLAKAHELSSVLISLNGDFSDIVRYPPSTHLGIISLQLKNRPRLLPALLEQLGKYLDLHPDQGQYKGKLFLVETYRIRIRS